MKLKKEIKDFLIVVLVGLLISVGVIAILWLSLEKRGNECDEAMGYTCSLYEIDNYNWTRK